MSLFLCLRTAPRRARATVSSYRDVASVVLSGLLCADHSAPIKSNIPPTRPSSFPPPPSCSMDAVTLDAIGPAPSSSRSFTAGPFEPAAPSPTAPSVASTSSSASRSPSNSPLSPSSPSLPFVASSVPAPSAFPAASIAFVPILTMRRTKLALSPRPPSFASSFEAAVAVLPVLAAAALAVEPSTPSSAVLTSSQVSFRLASHRFCLCCLAKKAMSSRLTLRLSTLAWCARAASCHPRSTPKKRNVSILRLRRLRLFRGSRRAQLHAAVANAQPRNAPSTSSDHGAYA